MAEEQEATARRLQLVEDLQLKIKGNLDFSSRRIFCDDELEYFERALIMYADMGWPMDYSNIQRMMRDVVKKRELIDWKTGEMFVVSRKYVADFVRNRPALRCFKMSHIDPLRSKKATAKVCIAYLMCLIEIACFCTQQSHSSFGKWNLRVNS